MRRERRLQQPCSHNSPFDENVCVFLTDILLSPKTHGHSNTCALCECTAVSHDANSCMYAHCMWACNVRCTVCTVLTRWCGRLFGWCASRSNMHDDTSLSLIILREYMICTCSDDRPICRSDGSYQGTRQRVRALIGSQSVTAGVRSWWWIGLYCSFIQKMGSIGRCKKKSSKAMLARSSHEQRERMMMVLNARNESLKASLKQLQDETQVETDSLRQEIRYVFKLGYILVWFFFC
jgi:hypothetical protein